MGAAPNSLEMIKAVGVQLQSSSLQPHITALEALKLFSKWNKTPVDLNLFEIFGLSTLQNKQYHAMSTGQKRRLHLALALVNDPQVIFLDEPTAGLDVEGRIALHNAIRKLKEKGKTIILASHDMAEVEALCDRIAILREGTIAFIGTTQEISLGYNNRIQIHIKTTLPIHKENFEHCNLQKEQNVQKEYDIYETEHIGDALFELLQDIKDSQNNIIDIKIERPTLEDKFIEIVQEASV